MYGFVFAMLVYFVGKLAIFEVWKLEGEGSVIERIYYDCVFLSHTLCN